MKSVVKACGNGKVALFDPETGKQISKCYDRIYQNSNSEYLIAKRSEKYVILNKRGIEISDLFDEISSEGLINGKSDYFRAKRNGKYAIFDKNGRQISDWFDFIYESGLITGESDCFIAKLNNKEATFCKPIYYSRSVRISQWHDHIYADGLIHGKSSRYYLAKDNGVQFIYDLFKNRRARWFGGINRDFVTLFERLETVFYYNPYSHNYLNLLDAFFEFNEGLLNYMIREYNDLYRKITRSERFTNSLLDETIDAIIHFMLEMELEKSLEEIEDEICII